MDEIHVATAAKIGTVAPFPHKHLRSGLRRCSASCSATIATPSCAEVVLASQRSVRQHAPTVKRIFAFDVQEIKP